MSINHIEEQQMETEALRSLFPNADEFIQISDKEFDMNLAPDPTKESKNHVDLTLNVHYPKLYPDVPPEWNIKQSRGLDEAQLSEIKSIILQEIDKSIGCPMMYMVAEAIQSYLQNHNRPPLSSYDEMMNRLGQPHSTSKTTPTATMKKSTRLVYSDSDDNDDSTYTEDSSDNESDALEHDDDDKQGNFKGLEEKQLCSIDERITQEQFVEWSAEFKNEMIANGVWGKKLSKQSRLTGKQMFEKDHSLVKTAMDDDIKEKNSDKMWKDKSLFEVNDEFLEDPDFSDED